MSVYVSAWVWRHSKSKGSTRLVLLALADIADDDGIVPPHRDASLARLAVKTQLDERTVRYCLRELEGKEVKIKGWRNHDKDHVRAGISPPELAVSPGAGHRPSRYQIITTELPFGIGAKHADSDLPEAAKAVDNSVDNEDKADSKGVASPPPTGSGPPLQGGTKVKVTGGQPPPESRIDVKTNKTRGAAPPLRAVDKKSETPYTPSGSVVLWAAKNGYAAYLHLHLDVFNDKLAEPAFRKRYTDLDAVFRNSVRGDWNGVRALSKRDARFGQGPDLETWWKTSDGVRAKGKSMELEYDPKRGGYPAYEIAVIDMAIDRDGWGAWADPRNASVYEAVINRRRTRGADIPEEEMANA